MAEPGIIQSLNPADYFTLAMDQEIRNDGMQGSLCAFALELDRTPDIDELNKRITEFTGRFPVSLASLQQRGRRFYWCQRESPHAVFFHYRCPDHEDETVFRQYHVEQLLNHQETREKITPLEFHLITGETKNTFIMRWIHPFCDARGADLILKYLCTDNPEQRKLFNRPETDALVYTQLKKFNCWQKIVLFHKARLYIKQIDQLQSIIPFRSKRSPRQLCHTIRRLTPQQTAMITEKARQYVGLTGISLYYIGCLMRALEKINPDNEGQAYCVPYAFNLRKQKALTPLLGNHVCALFAQAGRDTVKDKKQLFTHLQRQYSDVIRQQLDYAFLPLMWAGSWLSLEKYGKILRLSYKTGCERASFWFSDIGQPDISSMNFPGSEIIDLFHLCQIASPPALALLSCQYRQRLTFTYNYIEPLIGKTWVDELHEIMLEELLENR